jgi:hypothetical protein
MPEIHRVTPPASLMRETPLPASSHETNGDLLEERDDLKATLARCNADKANMRAWVEGGRDE